MPIYSYKIENSPLEVKKTPVTLEGDYLTKLSIKFPVGCCGLLKIAIFYGEEQEFPKEKDTYFHGDDEVVEWEGLWTFPEKPCPLIIYSYNEDDSYNHSAFIRLTTKYEKELLEERGVMQARRLSAPIIYTLSKLFGR